MRRAAALPPVDSGVVGRRPHGVREGSGRYTGGDSDDGRCRNAGARAAAAGGRRAGAAGGIERRAPRPAARAARLVAGPRPGLGHLPDPGCPVPAARRAGDLGVPPDDPQRAQPAAQHRAGLEAAAPGAAVGGAVDRCRGRGAVLRSRLAAPDSDGLPRGLRPDRLADVDRTAVPAVRPAVPGAVGGAAGALPGLRRRRAAAVSAPRVLVLVGTDHHRFDRLVDWMDRWCQETGVDCLVQHGTSRAPRIAAGQPYLDWDKVQSELAEADVVVSHGGPATIAEARRAGHLPVVVPRDPSRDEHVDDHQLLFSRRLGRAGLVALAETQPELRAALDAAVSGTRAAGTSVDTSAATAAATRRLGDLVDGLLPTRFPPPPRLTRPRVAFLGGFGRSGSTLLERMLAELPGITAIG